MSTHAVNVISITEVRPHPNADRLEIVPIGGWQAVVKKDQFKPGDLAIYIEPDYVVPLDRPEFGFLKKDAREKHRLKAIRLRGALSYGLLIPLPEGCDDAQVGDNVMEMLGVERYEPVVHRSTVAAPLDTSFWPKTYAPTFDLENIQNCEGMLQPGEIVVVTEKVDGANARYLFLDGVMHVGSRNRWLKDEVVMRPDGSGPYPRAIWFDALDRYPQIRQWCESHPGVTLFGEVYGNVQSLKYGRPNEIDFVAFAALYKDEWLDFADVAHDLQMEGIPTAPLLYVGPYDREKINAIAEQDSAVPGAPVGHMREGVVVTPVIERKDGMGRRVSLKLISNRFWESEA
jgi:RNA ligase (TIGR02306 family)